MSRCANIRTIYLLLAIAVCLGMATNVWAATNTTTSLTLTPPSPGSSVVGQPVTFTATVTPSASSGNALDGYVEFKDGTTYLGVAAITGNGTAARSAVFTTAKLAQGTRSVVATYLGNSSFNPSSSSANAYSVALRTTTTAVTSLGTNPVAPGQKSAVNVKVTDTANIPVGTRGSFTATGNAPVARTFFGQALLADGTVLLIGGKDGSTFKTSQIYDPGAGTFITGPALNTARIGATATALGNGMVLIAGGSTDGTAANAVASAEIYDPVGGTLVALPNVPGSQVMTTPRMNHTATLLDNGTVLIAGGVDASGTALDTTEIFTPNASGTSGSFASLSTATASTKLIQPRAGATATLLSGTSVLITGGDAGGDAEIYDASVPSSTAVAGANATLRGGARSFHAATRLPDGLVVITGGLVGSTVLDSVEFYDPATDSFTAVLGTMNVARQGHRTTLLPNGTVFIGGGSSTSAGNADLASAATYNPPYDPRGTVTITSSDGTDVIDAGTGASICTSLTLTGDGMPTCVGGDTPAAINTNPHLITASYADSGTVHAASDNTAAKAQLTVQAPITITAAPDSKPYDGTNAPSSGAVKPTLTSGTLIGADVLCATQTFLTKNAGATPTVSSTTFVIRDTNCAGADSTGQYNITYVPGAGNITPVALTITAAVADTKTYDGTTNGASTPNITSGTVQAGDTAAFTESFADRNAGTGKTVTPSGTVTDGNGGANYTYTFVPASDGVINQLATTITAASNTKIYDATSTAAALPIASPLGAGDTNAGLTEVYSDAKAGSGKTLTPSGKISDGNSGNNYTYTYVDDSTGVINARPLTVKAATNSKAYDATTSAAGTPTITSGALQGADTATFTEVYADRNAGVNKTLIPSGVANDGNGGNNYSYTYVNDTTGVITQVALTVTAATNTKAYDGTTGAAALPTITSGTLQGSDTAAFIEAYANRNAGVAKTLVPSGVANDGNAGANYAYTFVNDNTGVITQAALTITASVAATKTYDGTVAGTTLPVISSGAVQTGDTAAFVQSYADRNAGTGKTVTPSGTVTDGNGGANYTYVFVNATDGVINPLATTITAAANTKTYDATTTAAAVPTATPLGAGDTNAGLTEVYSDAKAGSGKTLIPSGKISDGNGGNNYTYTYANTTTGVINQLAVTVTAATNTKPYDGTTTAAAVPTHSALAGADTAAFIEAYADKNAGAGKTIVPSGVVNDGNSGNNYSYNYVNDTTGVITQAALTITAKDQAKVVNTALVFTGTEFNVTGTLFSGDTVTSATLASTGAAAGATTTGGNKPAGSNRYDISISAPVGTGLANYTITLVNGTLTVGAAPSNTLVDAQSVLSGGNSAFTFTATVTPQVPGIVPVGTVSFLMDGAAGPFTATYACVASGTGCKAIASAIVLPAGSHTIKATFNPAGTDFATSNSSIAATVVAATSNVAPGSTATVTASISYPGSTITIAGYTASPAALPLNNVNCVIVAAAGTVSAPPTCSITNTTYPITIQSAATPGVLTVRINTQGVTGASLRPVPTPGLNPLRDILAITMGFPAIVFIGLAVPGGRRRKLARGKIVRFLGLMLVVALLLAAVGCGGGFSNPNNAQPVVSANASTPGKYVAVINFKDSSGTHVLATVDFVVAAQ